MSLPTHRHIRSLCNLAASAVITTLTLAADAAPPANDTCDGVIVLGVGTHTGFSTVEANAEFPKDFSECGSIFEGPDIWFVFPPTVSGKYTISTCGSSFPTNIALYQFSCEGSGDCRNCISMEGCASFDASNCNGAGGASITKFLQQAEWSESFQFGVTYIRVSGVAPTDVGTVTLTITDDSGSPCASATEPCNVPHATPGCSSAACCTSVCDFDPTCCSVAWDTHCAERASASCSPYIYYCNPDAGGPPNDCATRATEISESGAYPFSLVTARPDGPATCGMRGQSLWWKFTATKSGFTLVNTCRYTNFNARTTVYDLGTDPASFDFDQLSFVAVGCDFENLCGNLGDTVGFQAVEGRTYLARVDNEIDTPAGTGRVAISMPWEYSCSSSGVANDCAAEVTGSTAVLAGTEVSESTTLPFDTAGATQDGPFLAFGDAATTAHDIWFWFRARRDGEVNVLTCGTANAPVFLQIFDLGTSVDAADFEQLPDLDVGASFGTPAGCATADAPVQGSEYYLVRIASMSRESFPAGTVTITMPECDTLVATASDGEACGTDTNGGCTTGTGFTEIALGETISGALAFETSGAPQDRDWYLLTLSEGTRVEIECSSEVPTFVFIRDQLLCSQSSYAVSDFGFCSTTSFCLPAGEHAIVVRAAEPVTGSGCDAPEYQLRVMGTAANCASVGDDVALLPPNQVSSTNPPGILPGIGVACGSFSTNAAEYAKPFPELAKKSSGNLEGNIEVIDFGWQHIGGSTNTGVIELYDDIDGGAPFREGVDLVLVESQSIQLWTTAFETPTMHRWKLDTPRPLANFVGHPVVILKTSASDVGFASFAGTNAPESTPTYIRSISCAPQEGSEDFIPIDDEFEDENWTVTVWGTFGPACPGDINNDGEVGAADLSLLLASWGLEGVPGDIDGDGDVGASDLSLLLAAWGPCN